MPEDLSPQEHIEEVKKRLETKSVSKKNLTVNERTKGLSGNR